MTTCEHCDREITQDGAHDWFAVLSDTTQRNPWPYNCPATGTRHEPKD